MGPTAKHESLQLGCPGSAREPLIWGGRPPADKNGGRGQSLGGQEWDGCLKAP